MAGHSHWANIAHKKGRYDQKRGKLFGKLSKAIIVAAQRGGDPAANLALRYAIDRAKKSSMPADTIERAIKKGTGELQADNYEQVLYEGYGPGGVAILCDILTENRNRTAGEVRRIFDIHGGNLGSTGCVAWMFDRRGLYAVKAGVTDEDSLMEIALDAGALDVTADGGGFSVICPPETFTPVGEALEKAGIPTESAEITMLPQNTVELDLEMGRAVLTLIEALEDNDDIQNVMSNFSVSEEVLAELSK